MTFKLKCQVQKNAIQNGKTRVMLLCLPQGRKRTTVRLQHLFKHQIFDLTSFRHKGEDKPPIELKPKALAHSAPQPPFWGRCLV